MPEHATRPKDRSVFLAMFMTVVVVGTALAIAFR
jgi:hypothetical protein